MTCVKHMIKLISLHLYKDVYFYYILSIKSSDLYFFFRHFFSSWTTLPLPRSPCPCQSCTGKRWTRMDSSTWCLPHRKPLDESVNITRDLRTKYYRSFISITFENLSSLLTTYCVMVKVLYKLFSVNNTTFWSSSIKFNKNVFY